MAYEAYYKKKYWAGSLYIDDKSTNNPLAILLGAYYNFAGVPTADEGIYTCPRFVSYGSYSFANAFDLNSRNGGFFIFRPNLQQLWAAMVAVNNISDIYNIENFRRFRYYCTAVYDSDSTCTDYIISPNRIDEGVYKSELREARAITYILPSVENFTTKECCVTQSVIGRLPDYRPEPINCLYISTSDNGTYKYFYEYSGDADAIEKVDDSSYHEITCHPTDGLFVGTGNPTDGTGVDTIQLKRFFHRGTRLQKYTMTTYLRPSFNLNSVGVQESPYYYTQGFNLSKTEPGSSRYNDTKHPDTYNRDNEPVTRSYGELVRGLMRGVRFIKCSVSTRRFYALWRQKFLDTNCIAIQPRYEDGVLVRNGQDCPFSSDYYLETDHYEAVWGNSLDNALPDDEHGLLIKDQYIATFEPRKLAIPPNFPSAEQPFMYALAGREIFRYLPKQYPILFNRTEAFGFISAIDYVQDPTSGRPILIAGNIAGQLFIVNTENGALTLLPDVIPGNIISMGSTSFCPEFDSRPTTLDRPMGTSPWIVVIQRTTDIGTSLAPVLFLQDLVRDGTYYGDKLTIIFYDANIIAKDFVFRTGQDVLDCLAWIQNNYTQILPGGYLLPVIDYIKTKYSGVNRLYIYTNGRNVDPERDQGTEGRIGHGEDVFYACEDLLDANPQIRIYVCRFGRFGSNAFYDVFAKSPRRGVPVEFAY